jgi:hypothetical protein
VNLLPSIGFGEATANSGMFMPNGSNGNSPAASSAISYSKRAREAFCFAAGGRQVWQSD